MSDFTPDAKQLAELASAFLATDFGQYYITQLSLQYNNLHQAAESTELSAEQKAMRIERAAGVKWTIDYLLSKDQLLKQRYFDKKEPEDT